MSQSLKKRAVNFYSGLGKIKSGWAKYKEQNKSKMDILLEGVRKLVQEKRQKDKVEQENSGREERVRFHIEQMRLQRKLERRRKAKR